MGLLESVHVYIFEIMLYLYTCTTRVPGYQKWYSSTYSTILWYSRVPYKWYHWYLVPWTIWYGTRVPWYVHMDVRATYVRTLVLWHSSLASLQCGSNVLEWTTGCLACALVFFLTLLWCVPTLGPRMARPWPGVSVAPSWHCLLCHAGVLLRGGARVGCCVVFELATHTHRRKSSTMPAPRGC